MNDSICFSPTISCETVGEIRKALEDIPDDTPLKSQGLIKRDVLVRYEEEKGNVKNRWVTLG